LNLVIGPIVMRFLASGLVNLTGCEHDLGFRQQGRNA
jgi:hypothetical protein